MEHTGIQELNWDGQQLELVRGPIKHLYLRISTRTGKVRISAPQHLGLPQIRAFYQKKLPWLQRHQARLQARHTNPQSQTAPEGAGDPSRAKVYLRGEVYTLDSRKSGPPRFLMQKKQLIYTAPHALTPARLQEKLKGFYKKEIKRDLPAIIQRWEPILGVAVQKFYVRQMKTKWGSCNPRRRTIRLNTELIHYPGICLEYVVLHEMIHILEPSHNKRFYALMDRFMPEWRLYREQLKGHPGQPIAGDARQHRGDSTANQKR